MVDNAPSVGILSCFKNPVDARDKNIQQRAESLSLAGALGVRVCRGKRSSNSDSSTSSSEQRGSLIPLSTGLVRAQRGKQKISWVLACGIELKEKVK